MATVRPVAVVMSASEMPPARVLASPTPWVVMTANTLIIPMTVPSRPSRGVIEAIVAALRPAARLESAEAGCDLFDPGQSCRLLLDGQVLGFVGRLRPEGLRRFDLRLPTTVAEVKLSLLVEAANLIPRHVPQPPYPAVTRDLNLVVDEAVRWAEVASTVRENCGEYFERLDYCDTYRDPERLGRDKKSLLLTIVLRWEQGTMTNQQADQVREQIVAACREKHGAELRA